MQDANEATLIAQGCALIIGERDPIANAANLSALLYTSLLGLNWVGVYFRHGDDLVLGPFQGRTARTRIPVGVGVCGRAAAERRTLIIPNVHEFPGHIACDLTTRSEIVVPLLDGKRVLGVLDVDSPLEDRFQEDDRIFIEAMAAYLVAGSDFPMAS